MLLEYWIEDTFSTIGCLSQDDTKLGYRFVHRQCHNHYLKTCFKELKGVNLQPLRNIIYELKFLVPIS
jgi:hypothetical protein